MQRILLKMLSPFIGRQTAESKEQMKEIFLNVFNRFSL